MLSGKALLRTAIFAAVALGFFLIQPKSGPARENIVYVVPVEGTITVGTANFVERHIREAETQGAEALIILMDTPGGVLGPTLDLTQSFMAARVPVVVLVAPRGAIAASAGAFLLVSSDIAAMAPATSVGAAQPVLMSPGGDVEPAEDKTVSFLASHMRSLARAQGRPEDIAKKFVTENLTLDAWEAEEAGLIEIVASSLDELLKELDGFTLEKHGDSINLQTEGARVVEVEMSLKERFQSIVNDPQIAFLLLMLGIMGIYFGLSTPGTFVPEVLGVIALVMGIYGMGLFDTSTAGIILLILGIGLITAEAFTAGFGIMGIGGGACIVMGALFLPLEPLMAPDWYHGFKVTVLGVGIGITLLVLVVIQRIITSRRQWKEGGAFFRSPEKAVVVEELNPTGMVKARGELWKAQNVSSEVKIAEGVEVEITGQEGLILKVRPLADKQE